MQNTKPKKVSEILKDVLKELAERSNVNYYAPEIKRETAIAEPAPMKKIDFEVGDFVRILANAKEKYIGRVGVIIGIRYKELEKTGPTLVYTVKFSDKGGAEFIADNMKFLRRAQGGEI